MEQWITYKGISIHRTRKSGLEFFEFVLNHAPYSVPYIEDVFLLIDLGLTE